MALEELKFLSCFLKVTKWGVVSSKTTCLTDNRMNTDVKTEHKNVKIYSLCKNNGMMNVFFLFIYHKEECNGRDRKC